MSAKLYVGNLDYTLTGDQLSEMFAQAGSVVSAVVISDRQSGRSKGFGFVEMENEEEANAAITALHESELSGRNIIVSEAKPRD